MLRFGVTLLVFGGVTDSYVWGLDFLRLEVSFLMFGSYFSYVWGLEILILGVCFLYPCGLVFLTGVSLLTFGG